MADTVATPSLLDLPAELIHHVLTFLEPLDLARSSLTCQTLRTLSYDDQIWQPIINSNLPSPIHEPPPLKSFRDLYIAHHSHWFLPKHRIWFGESEPNGKLLVARYDPTRGCIEAYTVVAVRGPHTLEFWEKDREVIIHSFDPQISLDLHQPVLRLDMESPLMDDQPNSYPSERAYAPSSRYSKETLMNTFSESGLYGSFMLCRALPQAAIGPNTRVWPPQRFPADARTRNDSCDGYNSTGHRPTTFSEVSQHNFRLRKWVEYTNRRSNPNLLSTIASSLAGSSALSFGGPYFTTNLSSSIGGGMSIRLPEDITTYATLPEWSYTPTKEKPWRGIWCGDYSGHGCEFLVILQPDEEDESPLPESMNWLLDWFRGGRRGSLSSGGSFATAFEDPGFAAAMEQAALVEEEENDWSDDVGSDVDSFEADNIQPPHTSGTQRDTLTDYEDVPTGRIEAIKLTGDPNIPRGEYTFIAPDIGHDGFLRVADEEVFRGARIIRGAGHIAGRGFSEDQYTPSQLIMISHDKLAQFWEGFGHISYYQRVDLDALIKL